VLLWISKKHSGTYSLPTAGADRRELATDVHQTHLNGSSLLKETMGSDADGHGKSFPMVCTDDDVKAKR
jgi:hypothetical protein